MGRKTKFFDQIEQLSALAKSSAELLGGLIQSFPKYDGLSDRLSNACSNAASVMQVTQRRLDDAFITPLDREDITQHGGRLADRENHGIAYHAASAPGGKGFQRKLQPQ